MAQHENPEGAAEPRRGRELISFGAHSTGYVRLYCVPYAGAGPRCYRAWQALIATGVEVVGVCLPGRDRRLLETPHTDIRAVVAEFGPILEADIDGPVVLFGHSVGALIAYEIARYLVARGLQPAHLVFSGRRPPQCARAQHRALHSLDDGPLVAALEDYIGLPPECAMNRRLLPMFVPVIRADLSIDETHAWEPGPMLACDITVLAGARDPDAPVDMMAAWAELTSGRCDFVTLDGDHFFIEHQQGAVVAKVADICMDALRRRSLREPT